MKKAEVVDKPYLIKSYFKLEKKPLFLVAFSGVIYNIGMTAGPFFEGQLAQRLFDIMKGEKTLFDMISLVAIYLLVILIVQLMRCVKRFYVRRFANDTGRNMRHMIYNSLVHADRNKLAGEGMGNLMTKAIIDVDACVEGMRKFTTEVFDTGVVLVAYLVMLFIYDWRLALLSCMFTPFAYICAQKLKGIITRFQSEFKKSAGRLNSATMDRIGNAVTYRVYGRESKMTEKYTEKLDDYSKKAIYANVWENAMAPIYNVISMIGAVLIIYFGAKNVLGTGWTSWNIAAFTTFLSCFTKMAVKSSKAAKLFNAVQKAQVSWKRIKPLMRDYIYENKCEASDKSTSLNVKNLSAGVIKNCTFEAKPGMIIGVTGAVASGKSTLGKVLIGEIPYEGSVMVCGEELKCTDKNKLYKMVCYQGHAPELMSDSIAENIKLGGEKDIDEVLKLTGLYNEVMAMPEGIDTYAGNGGAGLSGGQQDRVALARTLYHAKNILVLDDPLSAVDKKTEAMIMENLREFGRDKIIILISHRLFQFPLMDKVLFIDDGNVIESTHEELINYSDKYRELFRIQTEGGDLDD